MNKPQPKILLVSPKSTWLGSRWPWLNSIQNQSLIKLIEQYQMSKKINHQWKHLKYKVFKLLMPAFVENWKLIISNYHGFDRISD